MGGSFNSVQQILDKEGAMKKPIALFFVLLLADTLGIASAQPPFPPPGSLAARVAALEARVEFLQGALLAERTARAAADRQLRDQVSAVQAALAAVQNNSVLALGGKLKLDTVNGYPTALFTGINLQVVNGLGETSTFNGVGNVIIGYNAPFTRPDWYFCSDGAYRSQAACEAAGETFAHSHKTGSHYLVVGDQNNYSRYGGIVIGWQNTSNGNYASVIAGRMNESGGGLTGIYGGVENIALGLASTVSGGWENRTYSVDEYGHYMSVAGGYRNHATGIAATVSGGYDNRATGQYGSVSGGSHRRAETGGCAWAAGSLCEGP